MMTRLYYTEPWLSRFDGRVVAAADDGSGRQRVWLDRSAFYPTSGGQPFDTGVVNGLPVADVFEENDQVVHVVEGHLAVGDTVAGEIDWQRRLDHMQQHTGQHVLSAAFERAHQVRTESFHMGIESSTIDLAREVTTGEIQAAEDAANACVWAGRPVSIRFVSEVEARRLPLRKDPTRSGPLRLIEIDGYDLSACGGTHVSTTGEVGVIAVRSWERFRGGTRLEFVCGRRALFSYRAWRDSASAASRQLSVVSMDLPAAVERLLAEGRDTRRAAAAWAQKAATLEASTFARRAETIGRALTLVEALDDYDMPALKRLAAAFVGEQGRVVVLFTRVPPIQVVAMRSRDMPLPDCGTFVAALGARFGGRGGGKAEAAQAGGFDGPADELAEWSRLELRTRLTASG